MEDLVERAFTLHEYATTDELAIGPFTVRLCEVPHYITTFAIELTAEGRRLTYSADCAPNDEPGAVRA